MLEETSEDILPVSVLTEKKSETFLIIHLIKSAKDSLRWSIRAQMITQVITSNILDEVVAIKAIDMKGVKDAISREMLDC